MGTKLSPKLKEVIDLYHPEDQLIEKSSFLEENIAKYPELTFEQLANYWILRLTSSQLHIHKFHTSTLNQGIVTLHRFNQPVDFIRLPFTVIWNYDLFSNTIRFYSVLL